MSRPWKGTTMRTWTMSVAVATTTITTVGAVGQNSSRATRRATRTARRICIHHLSSVSDRQTRISSSAARPSSRTNRRHGRLRSIRPHLSMCSRPERLGKLLRQRRGSASTLWNRLPRRPALLPPTRAGPACLLHQTLRSSTSGKHKAQRARHRQHSRRSSNRRCITSSSQLTATSLQPFPLLEPSSSSASELRSFLLHHDPAVPNSRFSLQSTLHAGRKRAMCIPRHLPPLSPFRNIVRSLNEYTVDATNTIPSFSLPIAIEDALDVVVCLTQPLPGPRRNVGPRPNSQKPRRKTRDYRMQYTLASDKSTLCLMLTLSQVFRHSCGSVRVVPLHAQPGDPACSLPDHHTEADADRRIHPGSHTNPHSHHNECV